MRKIHGGALLLAWIGTAQAASFGGELGAIPLSSYLWVLVLAGLPGLHNVLAKIESGVIAPDRVWLSSTREMLGALLAGFTAFLMCETYRAMHYTLPDTAQAVLIGLAGYIGAKFIDKVASKAMDAVDSRIKP